MKATKLDEKEKKETKRLADAWELATKAVKDAHKKRMVAGDEADILSNFVYPFCDCRDELTSLVKDVACLKGVTLPIIEIAVKTKLKKIVLELKTIENLLMKEMIALEKQDAKMEGEYNKVKNREKEAELDYEAFCRYLKAKKI